MIPIALNTIEDYKKFLTILAKQPKPDQQIIIRQMLREDLFFLFTVGLKRKDAVHPWILARCKEVEANPNGHLDLWARGHYKSSIITFALTIQDILSSHGDNPHPKWNGVEVTVGIFSFNKPIAKQFLAQIKREFESNEMLRSAFPDILWENPEKDAPSWSLDAGIILKRKSNPKEATIEAHGVVEGQPTSKHFYLCVYDDVVTVENVRSPGMIEKTTDAWALSLNLGSEGGLKRYIGTRYSYNDTYAEMLLRKAAIPRIHTATVDGTLDGEPVLFTREALEQKRRDMGPYVYSSQMFQNPTIDSDQGFQKKWLNFQTCETFKNMNCYILVDPANDKKKTSDYTVMVCIGLASDENYYLLDIIRDRLSLVERADALFQMHRRFKPKDVGYEQYGMQADISHIKDTMKRINYNFKIKELGGKLSKVDRIRKLIPIFEQGRFYLPDTCIKTDYQGQTRDLIQTFINEEYSNFPVSLHDDMLDAIARIVDEKLEVKWPKLISAAGETRYQPIRDSKSGGAWGA